jgi:transposase-like protein
VGAPGRGTLAKDKPPILGLIQRGGQVVLRMLANVRQVTIKPTITATVAQGSLVHTDEYNAYARLGAWGYRHKTVCHARGEYARTRLVQGCKDATEPGPVRPLPRPMQHSDARGPLGHQLHSPPQLRHAVTLIV